jgi:hypothetical protein
VLEGLDQCPGAIARLYEGKNTGKLVVRLAGSSPSLADGEGTHAEHGGGV